MMARGCCWPYGDPGESGFRFCGATVADRSARGPARSYCPEHHRLAVRRPGDPIGPAPTIWPKPAPRVLTPRRKPAGASLVTAAAIQEAEAAIGPGATAGALAERLSVSVSTVRRCLRAAREAGASPGGAGAILASGPPPAG